MAKNYANSKIYKIEPICEHDESDIYIGATTKKYLSQRMDSHRHNYKSWKNGTSAKTNSYILFDKYGVDNCEIYLLEKCENATSIDDVRAREGYYIKTLKCVNRCVAGRSVEESMVAFKNENPNYFKKYSDAYRITNYDKIQKKCKLYYVANKINILNKGKTKKLCTCGCYYSIANKTNHCRTKKHQKLQNDKREDEPI
jgi:hypothetical protein